MDLVPRPLLATVVVGTKAVIITGRIAKATVAVAGKVVTTMAAAGRRNHGKVAKAAMEVAKAVGRRSLGRIMVKVVAVVVGRITITAVVGVGKTVMAAVTTVAGTKAAIMEAVGTKEETTLVATAVAV